jgi:hypothetical protein
MNVEPQRFFTLPFTGDHALTPVLAAAFALEHSAPSEIEQALQGLAERISARLASSSLMPERQRPKAGMR